MELDEKRKTSWIKRDICTHYNQNEKTRPARSQEGQMDELI